MTAIVTAIDQAVERAYREWVKSLDEVRSLGETPAVSYGGYVGFKEKILTAARNTDAVNNVIRFRTVELTGESLPPFKSTYRDAEVVNLVKSGMTYKAVAARMGMTRSAVSGVVYRERHPYRRKVMA